MPKHIHIAFLASIVLFVAACSNSDLENVSSEVLAARMRVNRVTPQISKLKTAFASVDAGNDVDTVLKAEAFSQHLDAVLKRYSSSSTILRAAESAIKDKSVSKAHTAMIDFNRKFDGVGEETAALSGRLQLVTTTALKRPTDTSVLSRKIADGLTTSKKLTSALSALRRRYPSYAEKFNGLSERIASLQSTLSSMKPKLKSSPLQEYILVSDRITTTAAGMAAAEKSVTQLREDLESERIISVTNLSTKAQVTLGRSCWDNSMDSPTEHITTFQPKTVPVEQFNYLLAEFNRLKNNSGTVQIAEIHRVFGDTPVNITLNADQKAWELMYTPVGVDLWQSGDDRCVVYVDDAYKAFLVGVTETVNGAVVHTSTEDVDEAFFKKTKTGDLLFKKSKGRLSEDAEIQKL
jgi:hypothetical protein